MEARKTWKNKIITTNYLIRREWFESLNLINLKRDRSIQRIIKILLRRNFKDSKVNWKFRKIIWRVWSLDLGTIINIRRYKIGRRMSKQPNKVVPLIIMISREINWIASVPITID